MIQFIYLFFNSVYLWRHKPLLFANDVYELKWQLKDDEILIKMWESNVYGEFLISFQTKLEQTWLRRFLAQFTSSWLTCTHSHWTPSVGSRSSTYPLCFTVLPERMARYLEQLWRQFALMMFTTRKPSYRWQTRATRKHAKIVPIRRAYNVVADNTGLSSFV